MSESLQEKTEQATEQKLNEASDMGQVAYSTELTNGFMFLLMMGALWLFGGQISSTLATEMRRSFFFTDLQHIQQEAILGFLVGFLARNLSGLIPIFIVVIAVILTSGFLQVGFKISFKRIEIRMDKLDPAKGVKKIFSIRSVMSTALALLKVAIVSLVVFSTLQAVYPLARQLGEASVRSLIVAFPDIFFGMGFKVGALVLILGVFDILFQRWRHAKDMMMTKDDVKEDRKRTEGDPKVKARIREVQRAMSRARMMADVKTATVVVRNPTHYAVALRYDRDKEPAPRVVAKGKNLVALKIIEIAEKAGVPVKSEPPLARELHKTVALGKVIPDELFQAAAKILAWVYRKKEERLAS